MKKISTVARKQRRNISEQKLTIGLDLGDRSSWYCVLDGAGEVVLEQKLSTTPKAIKEVLGGMPRCRVALETGMHSPWVSRVLGELGHEVIVAHARNVRLIGESRCKQERETGQRLPCGTSATTSGLPQLISSMTLLRGDSPLRRSCLSSSIRSIFASISVSFCGSRSSRACPQRFTHRFWSVPFMGRALASM
jgi:hypothetical protein